MVSSVGRNDCGIPHVIFFLVCSVLQIDHGYQGIHSPLAIGLHPRPNVSVFG